MSFRSNLDNSRPAIPVDGGLNDADLATFAYSMWWERKGDDLPETDDLRLRLWDAERVEALQLARQLLQTLNFNGFVVTRS